MSFGGRDDRDSKRKHQWSSYNRGAKRFHGISESPREQFHRGIGPRWDRGPRTQESFSKSHRSPGPLKESEDLVGPGSELERMEKVLATKKRIEEALASKSSDSNKKEINFQNASTSSGGKSKEKESHGPNLDLRLTNSDFKEIGSVASAIPTDGDMETSDFMKNVIPNVTAHISQQRSFDNTTSNSTTNIQALQQKSQKVGGWSMSAVNDIVSKPNNSCPLRSRGDMFLQEPREEILGNVSTASTGSTSTVDPSSSKQSYDNQNYRDEFSRVGRLYQSFLKSRLFGYTLKVKDKSSRLAGPNPLLDKSVLDSHSSDRTVTIDDQVLELQMPQPIRIKMDNNDSEHTPEQIAAEEANEFCKEFSFLLKDPDFLIPPDHLEKLGLGHLSEMNKLINDKRIRGASGSSVENQDGVHQKKDLNAMNSVSENDAIIIINTEAPPFSISDNVGIRGSIDRFKERDCLLNNDNSNHDCNSIPRSQGSPLLDQTLRPDILSKENAVSSQSPQISSFHNVSVEAVVEKVVKTMLQPSNINSVLNTNIPSTVDTHTNLTKNTNEGHLPGLPGTTFSDINSTSLNQMQNVSSKILRMFLIDKQVEELMAEKMKIYSELLSSEGVSQTLFHSWAEDQIQQGNVMSVIASTSNIIPELDRVINRNVQETNPNQTLNVQLEETISELYSLKKEYENANMTTPQAAESSPCRANTFPPDSCFLAPKVLEENRPKLSVRKDLLDPNRSNVSLLNTPVEISAKSIEDNVNPSDCRSSQDADRTTLKREKKKKWKKKEKLEVINLIEDTDDEISSAGTGVESVAGLNSEDEVDKKLTGNTKISYELNAKTATCMATMKAKKQTNVMVVGCKDGSIMGYLIGNPAISFVNKIHNDTIMAIFCIKKFLITGSLDSTICLFSLKEQVETQTLTLNASVQSMDINFGELIVGTKVGSVYSYTIKVEEVKKKVYVSLHPNKKALVCSDHKSSILAVKLAMEGARKVLIVASRGEQITVRDANNGQKLRIFDWCDTVFCLQLYEDTPLVYCGTNNKSVKVVNYTDGVNASDCTLGRSITQIVFLYSVMFAASYDGTIYVYDVEKNNLMATVIASKGIIQCLAIDSKNSLILVASSRGDLQQFPFPTSVAKRLKKLKFEKKNCQNKMSIQP